MSIQIYVNGEFFPKEEAKVSVLIMDFYMVMEFLKG